MFNVCYKLTVKGHLLSTNTSMQTYIYKQIHKLQPGRPQDVCFFVYKFKKQDYECFTIPGLSHILSHHNKLSLLY
jgi:hypothetical protein